MNIDLSFSNIKAQNTVEEKSGEAWPKFIS